MKTLFSKIIICLIIFVFAIGLASANTINVKVQESPLEPIEEDIFDRRAPSRPIYCTINEDGVIIQGMEQETIISYEVYDLNADCLLISSNQLEFCSFVLSSCDSIEIRLVMVEKTEHAGTA